MSAYPRVVGAFADESYAYRIVEVRRHEYLTEVRSEQDAMGAWVWRYAAPTETAFYALRAAYGRLCSARLDDEEREGMMP